MIKIKKILFIEDDLALISGLTYAMEKEGYIVDVGRTKGEAEKLWKKDYYDLVILDVSLPDGSGYDICKNIREESKVAVIFLTARDEETDIIMGLDIGGDDYITKPFKLSVFLFKIKALFRRSDYFKEDDKTLKSNGIKVKLLEREVYKNNERLYLTAGEYKLLCLFLENEDMVLSQNQILDRLWDLNENYIEANALSVYIYRLRSKIEDDISNPERIITVRGLGYKWNSGK